MIGQMLNGFVDEDKSQVFGMEYVQVYLDAARVAVRLYDECCNNARGATMSWMIVAKRLGLYRDVAMLIGGMVWDDRAAFMERICQRSTTRIAEQASESEKICVTDLHGGAD